MPVGPLRWATWVCDIHANIERFVDSFQLGALAAAKQMRQASRRGQPLDPERPVIRGTVGGPESNACVFPNTRLLRSGPPGS